MEYFLDLFDLFLIFAKIGLFTIGGGYAMLPLMQRELVDKGLMTAMETTDMVAISQMTPGPFAVNAATFSGMRVYGVPGAVAATLGAVLPSVIITLLVAKFFFTFYQKPLTAGALSCLRPAVLGLICFAAIRIAMESMLISGEIALVSVDWFVVAAATGALVLLQTVKKISPIAVILLCGLMGIVFEFLPIG